MVNGLRSEQFHGVGYPCRYTCSISHLMYFDKNVWFRGEDCNCFQNDKQGHLSNPPFNAHFDSSCKNINNIGV